MRGTTASQPKTKTRNGRRSRERRRRPMRLPSQSRLAASVFNPSSGTTLHAFHLASPASNWLVAFETQRLLQRVVGSFSAAHFEHCQGLVITVEGVRWFRSDRRRELLQRVRVAATSHRDHTAIER